MIRTLIALAALLVASPALAQQRPTNAAAIDGSDAPALADYYGPQAAIADGLDTSTKPRGQGLVYDEGSIPSGGFPDNVGAFRFDCTATHIAADDPIVNPGKPGGAHIHTFFGNTGANANSTYTSLRTTGQSSCLNALWRSAYWIPSMLDGPGADAKVIWPKFIAVYYKRYPKTSSQCTPGNSNYMGRCVGFPRGLKLIANYDMVTQTAPTGVAKFKCIVYTDQNSGGYSGAFTPDMVTALATCPTNVPSNETNPVKMLDLLNDMPQCWDGKNLDSANHRSHMADSIGVDNLGEFCPKTHPYVIPRYTAQVLYVIDSTANQSGTWTSGQQTWYLSSDRMPGKTMMRPGTTMHFDVFDAASEFAKTVSTDNCIDLLLNCSAGVMGDGRGLQPDPAFAIGYQHPKSIRPKMTAEAAHGIIHGPM